jgi:outer membrane protein insertion porin family
MTTLAPGGCSLRRPRLRWRSYCLCAFLTLACWWTQPAHSQVVNHAAGFSPPKAIPAATSAEAARIVEVRVDGASRIDAADLARALRCRPGQVPSRGLMLDDVESLLATGRFARVEPKWERTAQGWALTYIVAETAEPWTPAFDEQRPPVFPEAPVRRTFNVGKPTGRGPWTSEVTLFRAQSDDLDAHSPPVAPRSPLTPADLAQPGTASAALLDEPLADVRIEGNVTIPVSEIERHVKIRKGRVVTQELIKADVNALMRTRWFASVEPTIRKTDDGPVLTFRVLERPIVRSVEYRGCRKIKQPKLEALTNLKKGSPYDVSANRECARRIEELYHQKGFAFATVELERGNSKEDREVVFVINEGEKVKVAGVEFEGNKFFSDAILDLKLRTKKRFLWVIGGKWDPTSVKDDMASVASYYNSLGFFDVDIQHALKFNDDKSLVQIVYTINEGPRYQIRRVDVIGAEVIPEDDLRKDHTIAPGEFYTARKINADVEKMRDKYGRLGRLFAQVDAVPRFTEEPGVVDILYKINEDRVYRVRQHNIHIAGDHPHTRTNLARNMSLLQPGDLADPQLIQRTKRRLEGSGVFETGPEMGPRMEIKRIEEQWVRQPQNPISIARGQQEARPHHTGFTPPAALKGTEGERKRERENGRAGEGEKDKGDQGDELPYFVPVPKEQPQASTIFRGQGDVLLTQSQDPLKNPQNYIYDSSPQGDPLRPAINDPDPNLWMQLPPPQFIDIDTYLTEARTGRLMFGVGVNSNSGVVGNIVLSENNFDILRPPTSWEDIWNGTAWRGAGQKFRIEALPGTEVSRYLVDWQDPYFLDTDVNLGVSGFYYTRFFRNWDEERIGGRVRLGRQLSQTWSASVALRLEGVDISDIPPTPPQLLAEAAGDSFLSTVRLGIAHDTRDAAFIPSEGHFVEFAVEQAFAEFNYTRFEIEGRQFFTTYQRPDGYGKHILTLSGQFGWTGNDTPIYERFFAGGFQSFRGFAFRGVTPLENGVEIGGQFQLLGTVEYMLPVMANEMIKVVAFSDFGTVDEDVSLDDFRVSVGAGLRIQVPGMGPVPIALDWAVPVVKQDFDREQLFSFYIGINR